MVAQPPVTNLARKFKMNIIAEPEDFGGAYPTTPVAARISFIKDKRETVAQIYSRAVGRHSRLQDAKGFQQKSDRANTSRPTITTLWKTATSFSPAWYRKNPTRRLTPIKEALAELGEKDPKVRSAKPEDFADMSVIKEFDDNGFIDGLYKKR